jgi:hypothetical protein
VYDGMEDAKHFGKRGLHVNLQIRLRRNNIAPSFAQSSTLVIAIRCSDQ